MSRYAAMFQRLAARGEGAFGSFLMIGDPDIETSAALLDAVVAGGADMIEVGIPFSDPIADGPVIQAAAKRALDAGVGVADCFDLIARFRERHPQVIADVPALEAERFTREMEQAGLEPVMIAAANTPDPTLERIAELSKAYTYCVSRAGITGTHSRGQFDRQLIARLKQLGAPPPVFGFGISRPEDVREALDSGAAGVICGSAIVDVASRGGNVVKLVDLLKTATLNDKALERLGDATIVSP
jgi:tryptophan synthase alpha chain